MATLLIPPVRFGGWDAEPPSGSLRFQDRVLPALGLVDRAAAVLVHCSQSIRIHDNYSQRTLVSNAIQSLLPMTRTAAPDRRYDRPQQPPLLERAADANQIDSNSMTSASVS